jgi:hypothetical protein
LAPDPRALAVLAAEPFSTLLLAAPLGLWVELALLARGAHSGYTLLVSALVFLAVGTGVHYLLPVPAPPNWVLAEHPDPASDTEALSRWASHRGAVVIGTVSGAVLGTLLTLALQPHLPIPDGGSAALLLSAVLACVWFFERVHAQYRDIAEGTVRPLDGPRSDG